MDTTDRHVADVILAARALCERTTSYIGQQNVEAKRHGWPMSARPTDEMTRLLDALVALDKWLLHDA